MIKEAIRRKLGIDKIKTKDYTFTDAQEMAKLYPDTFQAPLKKDLAKIKKGSIVKVSHNNERFWTIVKSVKGNKVTAKVDNDLICEQPFKCGDTIKFEKKHIYSIWGD
jgi:hypothetical protein